MLRTSRLLIILVVLFRVENAQGSLEAYHHENGGLVKSVSEQLCHLALENFYFPKCYLRIGNQATVTVRARLERLAFRNDTGRSQAIAILEFVVFQDDGTHSRAYYFVCLENCSLDEEAKKITIKLSMEHTTVDSYDNIDNCLLKVTEFEKSGFWPLAKKENKNIRPKSSLPHKLRKVGKYVGGGGGATGTVAGIAGGVVLCFVCLPAGLVVIAGTVVAAISVLTKVLVEDDFIEFEIEFVDVNNIDVENATQKPSASTLSEESPKTEIKPSVSAEQRYPDDKKIDETNHIAEVKSTDSADSQQDIHENEIGANAKPVCKKIKKVSVLKRNPKTNKPYIVSCAIFNPNIAFEGFNRTITVT